VKGGRTRQSGRSASLGASSANKASAYIWTPDADALFAELAPKLADLPDWRVRPPFTQPYGMREFHVKDPDGFLLFFAEDPFAPKGSAPRH
ncbi:MAG: hypothetical protein AAFR44_02115, partial [Pseudomonadota bacterium]